MVQVIILGDSGVGKTSLMNQYVRLSSSNLLQRHARHHQEVLAYTESAGQQEVQRKLQSDHRCRLPDQGGPGRRQAGDDAGGCLAHWHAYFGLTLHSSGTLPAKSVSNRWALLFTAAQTAACSSTTSTIRRASIHWIAGGTSSWCRLAQWTRRASHSYVASCNIAGYVTDLAGRYRQQD